MATALLIVNIVLAVLGGAIAVLALVAPATKTESDNKALAVFRWIDDKVRALLELVVRSGVQKKS